MLPVAKPTTQSQPNHPVLDQALQRRVRVEPFWSLKAIKNPARGGAIQSSCLESDLYFSNLILRIDASKRALLTQRTMLEPGQRMRTSRRSSMRLRAVCSEWVAIIPMMVKEITSAVTMSFGGGCVGVSPFDEHTISPING